MRLQVLSNCQLLSSSLVLELVPSQLPLIFLFLEVLQDSVFRQIPILFHQNNALQFSLSAWFNFTSRIHYLKKRSEEHTSELQSLMRISYAVFCLKKKKKQHNI